MLYFETEVVVTSVRNNKAVTMPMLSYQTLACVNQQKNYIKKTKWNWRIEKGFRQPIPTKRKELESQAISVSHQSVHFPADVSSVPNGAFEHLVAGVDHYQHENLQGPKYKTLVKAVHTPMEYSVNHDNASASFSVSK